MLLKWFIGVLLLVHLCSGETSKPEIVITQGSNPINSGSELQLNCTYQLLNSSATVSIQWYHGNPLSVIAGETTNLFTKTVQRNDAGDYVCETTSDIPVSSKMSEAQNIVVNYFENVNLVTSTEKPIEDDRVVLSCNVDTNLPQESITFTFTRNGVSLQNTTSNEYVFENIQKENAGNYQCSTTNGTLTSGLSTLLQLSVDNLFTAPVLLVVPSTPVPSNGNIAFTCNINPTPIQVIEYRFFKDNSPLNSFSTDKSFQISQLTTSDSGGYTCQGKNNTIMKTSASVTVQVNLQVVVNFLNMVEGTSANATCDVQGGEPIHNVTWTINNVIQSETTTFLPITNVQRSSNGDVYKCFAVSLTGAISSESSRTLQVYWLDNPTVAANDSFVGEGKDVFLSCNISSNPSPSKYYWFKNGQQISLNDEINNILFLRSVTKDDTGTYTCATNNSQISTLKISSNDINIIVVYFDQPTITFIDGTSSPVIEGQPIHLSCNVANFLNEISLVYQWTKENKVLEQNNAQLSIPAITRSDANGPYKCTVTGTFMDTTLVKDTSQSVTVHYLSSSLMFTSAKTEEKVGNIFTQECDAIAGTGNPSAVLRWFRNSETSPFGSNNLLRFNPVVRSDSATYTCRATNAAGTVNKTFEFKALDIPDVPLNFNAASTTPVSIALEWQAPLFDGNKPINYTLKYSVVGSGNFFTVVLPSIPLSYNLSSLQPAITYQLKLQAVNSIGSGNFTNLITVVTGESAPSVPRNLRYDLPTVSEQITFNWDIPDPTNGIIIGYTICYQQTTEDGTPVNHGNICNQTGDVTTYTLSNLGKYNGYDVSVFARNSVGSGPSATISAITKEEQPTLVTNVNTVASERTILVKWERPANIFGILAGYTVSSRQEGVNQFTDSCINITTTQCNITSLDPFRSYSITITVRNSMYSSSATTSTITLGIAPPVATPVAVSPDLVEENSFTINLPQYDQTNGKVRNFDIILFKLSDKQLPSRLPSSYSNAEISTRVVGRLTTLSSSSTFKIGITSSKRKRRSLGTPNNPLLESGTFYAVFIRAYISDNVFSSSDWYQVIETDSAAAIAAGAIAGIIVALLLIFIIIAVLIYWMRCRNRKNNDKELFEQGRKKPKSFRGMTSPGSDPRIPIQSDRFEEHVNRLKANSNYGFSQEYAMISRELDYPYSHSRLQENNIKNRYHNVPAYDETRVKLEVIDGDQHMDYINANLIEGFHADQEYIATQGPLPETVFDFWRMAWESESTTIVMLTRLEEKGRVKCAQYWPDSGSLSLKDIVITATDVHEFPDHVVRTFHVTRTGQAIERNVKQFHFTAWPDFGVPNDPSSLLNFVRKVNTWKGLSNGPVIVHCSAGVGRTGTYITIDTQIKNIKKNKQIAVFTNVSNIRQQRCLMVQTEDQYIFIHHALLDHLESGDTEVDVNQLRDYVKKQSQIDSRTGMTGLMEEFIRLAKTDKKDKFTDANKNVNQAKNRYKNVYPYDDSRVRLSHRPGVEGSDYINANYIDSYGCKDMFIATQAPLESTMGDFWRMIWEQNSGTIVMLSKEVEGTQVKVHAYWPLKTSSKIEHFIVELASVTTYGDYVVRDLKLTNTEASSSRQVKQFQYTTWPDSGSPESGVGIIELIGQVQKWNASINNKIITVHCSAGVGRTGVFIALTNLIERVKTEAVVDVYQAIKKMRQQRTAMVQTRDQYEFIFRALQEYLDSFDLYANFQ